MKILKYVAIILLFTSGLAWAGISGNFAGGGAQSTGTPFPGFSSSNPSMDGTASPGVGVTASKYDHVHPTDITRAGLGANDFTDTQTMPTEQIQSTTANTGGGYSRALAEATSGALSGASGSIAVNVPSGSRILGVQLRVDTAITSGAGASWSAVYVNTPTTAICSGQAFSKNTKFNAIHPAYEITTGTVTITVTPNTGTFTAGVVRAVVYYESISTLSNEP
jgi:hypothetical protein